MEGGSQNLVNIVIVAIGVLVPLMTILFKFLGDRRSSNDKVKDTEYDRLAKYAEKMEKRNAELEEENDELRKK